MKRLQIRVSEKRDPTLHRLLSEVPNPGIFVRDALSSLVEAGLLTGQGVVSAAEREAPLRAEIARLQAVVRALVRLDGPAVPLPPVEEAAPRAKPTAKAPPAAPAREEAPASPPAARRRRLPVGFVAGMQEFDSVAAGGQRPN